MALEEILCVKNPNDKLKLLNSHVDMSQFPEIQEFLKGKSIEMELAVKSVLFIGEGPIVFRGFTKDRDITPLIQVLLDLEKFYEDIGGIIGYHTTVLKLIDLKNGKPSEVVYKDPDGIDITDETADVRTYIRWGIESIPHIGEIYPVGGAGDRLGLKDEIYGDDLPAAQLLFGGRTLLEGLIRDLYAREYLYFKLFGKKIVTPVALMTSEEKNNHKHIVSILKKVHWFGRPQESFFIFKQPLVPVIGINGHWCLSEPLKLVLKPGGHGAIWKLAKDQGVFKWFESQNRSKAMLRQINNPVAGVDYGLIAFMGYGFQKDKAFGFASCPRLLNASEGMDVLVEKHIKNEYEYCISNIEYTDFKAQGIEDVPVKPDSPYSRYPANTNLLFVDLKEIEKAIKKNSIPGMLINFKNKSTYTDPSGEQTKVYAGRLESTMQNISDDITDTFPQPINENEIYKLRSYLTHNKRRKTISVTKKSYQKDLKIFETPEGCFYDMLKNGQELLRKYCGVIVPEMESQEDHLEQGPRIIFAYNPALGPLYSIIAQKIQGGHFHENSELQLEITEVDIKKLELNGSLLVISESLEGRCTLHDVSVDNRGINRSLDNFYWKNQIQRAGACVIMIEGNGEFVAEKILFQGNQHVVVPNGYRYTAYMDKGSVQYKKEIIDHSSWSWNYTFDSENKIIATKN